MRSDDVMIRNGSVSDVLRLSCCFMDYDCDKFFVLTI